MPKISKEKVVRTYLRLVEENGGRLIGERVFHRDTGISRHYWQGGYWRSWSDFQEQAGFTPNKATAKTPDEVLLQRFCELALELGFPPNEADLMLKRKEDSTFPSKNTFRRWGARPALLEKVVEYSEDKEEFAEVYRQLRESLVAPSNQRQVEFEKGFVYLLRSGKNYKIGRTNATGRRFRELSIQLPDKPDTVHVIETDDPEGIEQYWHRRFAEKRKGGEWFVLSPEDVAAFKRRKFQ